MACQTPDAKQLSLNGNDRRQHTVARIIIRADVVINALQLAAATPLLLLRPVEVIQKGVNGVFPPAEVDLSPVGRLVVAVFVVLVLVV